MTKPSKFSGPPRPGSLVEFLQDNEPHLAWVLEEAGDRLRLLTRQKREVKLPAARLLPWIGPDCAPNASREEIFHRLEATEARRRELAGTIDTLELWDMAQGELERAPVDWFAGLLWQDCGVDELAALGRALLAAKTHFKFQPPDFEIHPAAKVEARMAQQRAEKEREAVASAGHALFQALWARVKSGQTFSAAPLPEARDLDPEVAARLQGVLRFQISGKSPMNASDEALAKLWEGLRKSLPDERTQPHLPLLLAQAWGMLPAHHNHLLDQAGYDWGDGWSEAYSQEIMRQLERFEELRAKAEAEGIDPAPFVSIDAATTKDIDDAFLVSETTLPDGSPGWLCAVALARPTLCWDFGAPLDREVMNRVTSLYLPEGDAHMMPETLGTGLYSLTAGSPKPALIAEFLLDPRGEIVDTRPRLAWISVARNVAYEEAQAAIESDSDAQISLAAKVARELFARRLERGAVVIQKPEPVTRLSGAGADIRVDMELKPPSPDAELLVSEFMILANCGLACWAREQGIPLLHRSQNIALPPSATGVFNDPADIARVVKLLAPPVLDCQPKRHAALACEAYATLTSPIRRYIDLVNMAQVESHLATGTPRLDLAALEALATHLSARNQEVGQVQRFRPRYWKLLYLAQHRKQPFQAVVVEDAGPYPTLSLPDLQITVRLPRNMLGEKIHPGMPVEVLFGRIDPLTNELKVLEAREAE